MANYTYSQLEALWIQAGGPSSVAPIAAAIALAESSGNSGALNLTDNNGTQTSVGLWQVSNGTHQYPQSWLTAAGNAQEAVAKFKAAGGFSPWGTYDSGAYRSFLQSGVAPATSVPGGGSQVPGIGPNQIANAGAVSANASTPITVPSQTSSGQSATTTITGLYGALQSLLHGAATVIDYSFSMFEPGQGFRLLFALGTLVLMFLSYKSLAAAGAVPEGLIPKAVPGA